VRSFWQATLKSLGIRYRRPYNMRHTYATLGLMNGLKPAFLAKQLGHSLQVFFQVYAKWISSSDDRAEVAKLDDAVRQKTQLKPKLNARSADEATNG
jgi:integrase